MRFFLSTLLFCGVLGLCSQSFADDLDSTLNQPIHEISHDVVADVQRDYVTLTVTRTFANLGKKHDEAFLHLDLPFGAVATRLRIRSGLVWHEAQLMDAKKALQLYEKLTGLGPHRPKDPALLRWSWNGELILQVFPVPPKGTAVVQYTLSVPTTYQNGQHVFYYPRHQGKKNLATPQLRVVTSNIKDKIKLGADVPLAQRQAVVLKHQPRPLFCRKVDPSHGCAISTLNVPTQSSAVGEAQVAVEIKHSYRGDLRVDLFSPTGHRYPLFGRKGGSKNNLSIKAPIKLKAGDALSGVWTLRVEDAASLDTGILTNWSMRVGSQHASRHFVPASLPVYLPDATNDEHDKSMQAFFVEFERQHRWFDASYAAVDKLPQQHFANLHVDVARRLSDVPKNMHVVFVVDASHSQGLWGVQAQIEAIKAYLQHTPGAHVEVVLTRRKATRLFGHWVPLKDFNSTFQTLWRKGTLETGNGSHLDRGMLLGLGVLEKAPKTATRRMVVLTDGLLRSAYSDAFILPSMKATQGIVTHIVDIHDRHRFHFERDDDHDLYALAKAHGGIVTIVGGLPSLGKKSTVRALAGQIEHLVRPIRLENVALYSGPKADFDVPDTLNEGEGYRAIEQVDKAPSKVVLTANLWSKKIKRVITNTRAFEKLSAGWVFSHDLHEDLTVKQQYTLAMFAGVVSPQTSFLAIEPGVRPSIAGIDRGGGRGMGLRGKRSRIARLMVGATPQKVDKYFKPVVDACVKKHTRLLPASWVIKFRVEFESREILDVPSVQTPDKTVSTCIVEGIWALNLTGHQKLRHSRRMVTLTFKS